MSVKDAAIHNYLLSLYARLKPHELLTYLNFQGHVSLPVIMTSVLSMLFKKMYTCLSVSVFVNKSLCNIIHVKSAYDLFVVFIWIKYGRIGSFSWNLSLETTGWIHLWSFVDQIFIVFFSRQVVIWSHSSFNLNIFKLGYGRFVVDLWMDLRWSCGGISKMKWYEIFMGFPAYFFCL